MIIDLLPGLPIKLDPRSTSIGGSFFYDPPRVYDPEPLLWAYEKLKVTDKPMLIDVGASSGCFALLAVHIPELQVLAIEPTNAGFDLLFSNVMRNNIADRVKMANLAVGNYNGKGILNQVIDEGGLGCTMLGGVPFEGKLCKPVEVNVSTIDSLVETYKLIPTMIKIDTEGGELDVLLGAMRTLKLFHPVIVSEWEPICTAQYGYHPNRLVKMLQSLRYHCEVHGTNFYAEPN